MASIDPAVLSDFNYQSEVFQDTLRAKLVDTLALSTSGILMNLSDSLIQNTSGDFASIPQYKTADGVMNQVVSLTESDVDDFGDYKTKMPWLQRDKGWGVENLVQIIGNKEPIEELVNQLTTFASREIQTAAINVYKGIFDTALASTHSTGLTYEGSNVSKEAILAAKQLQGDMQYALNKFIGNSKVVSDAMAFSMSDFTAGIVGSEVYRSGRTGNVLGMEVWADDLFEAVTSVYSSYISAPGSTVYGFRPWKRKDVNGGNVVSANFDVEYQRVPNIGGGRDILWFRVSYTLGVPGVSWNVATTNPTNAQLATGSNWAKTADDNKKINIVELRTA